MSTASGDVVKKQQSGAKRPLRPITWVIIAIVLVVAFGTMAAVIFGLWPTNGGVSEPPAGQVTPTSSHAAGLKVEPAGTPVRDGDQVTLKVKITNNVMQAPPIEGTQTPNAPTPAPEPAKVYNATVKVLYYDKAATDSSKKIVGSGIGNYYNEQGLPNGSSDTLDVVATGVGDFQGYEVFPDTVWTDKDPVKPQTPVAP